MFDELREALSALAGSRGDEERRRMTHGMRDALIHARMALNEVRSAMGETAARLEAERKELETVRRRRGLAADIGDSETVAIADRFAAQHAEKVAMLETKLMSQQQELAVTEHEYESMSQELKRVMAGLSPSGGASSPESAAARELDEFLNGSGAGASSRSGDDLSVPQRRTRAEKEADADARLSELKRKMGR